MAACVLVRVLKMRGNIGDLIEIFSPVRGTNVDDQRCISRLPLTYPLFLSRPGEACRVVTKTENVTSKGFYCVSARRFLLRERLDCEMLIPLGSSGFPGDLVLHALVEVLRVTPRGLDRGFGMACRLESYTIAPRSDLPPGA
jgi:hypothetical protein